MAGGPPFPGESESDYRRRQGEELVAEEAIRVEQEAWRNTLAQQAAAEKANMATMFQTKTGPTLTAEQKEAAELLVRREAEKKELADEQKSSSNLPMIAAGLALLVGGAYVYSRSKR